MEFYELDIRTVMRLMFIGNLMILIMFAAYMKFSEKEQPYWMFIYGKILQSIGWFLLALRGEIPDLFGAYVANVTLFSGFALEVIGLIGINRAQGKYKKILLSIVIVGSIVFCFSTTSPTMRVGIASLIVAALYLSASYWMSRSPKCTHLCRTIVSFYAIFSIVMLFRSAFGFLNEISLFSGGIIQTLTFVSLFGFMLAGSVGYLLLLKEKEDEQLLEAATTDPLTGVFNRRAFLTHTQFMTDYAIRMKAPVSMMILDIDHFKVINDTYGHPVGDIVLTSFAQGVKEFLRPHDVFGRIGGEEFGVFLSGTSEETYIVAERIRGFAENQTFDDNPHIRYTISIGGYTMTPQNSKDIETMMKMSDDALYEAKNSGRNRVVLYSF